MIMKCMFLPIHSESKKACVCMHDHLMELEVNLQELRQTGEAILVERDDIIWDHFHIMYL